MIRLGHVAGFTERWRRMGEVRRYVRRLAQDMQGVCRTADRASARQWCAAIATHLPTIVQRRGLTPADAVLARRTCVFRTPGAPVTVPGKHFSLARELYCRGVYWPSAEYLPHPGDFVMDLGSNIGLYSIHAVRSGAARVIAVEALTQYDPAFQELAGLNGTGETIERVHLLVGGDTGQRVPGAWRDWCPEEVQLPPTVSIGELMSDYGWDHIDLLKMDIEGSEYQVFSGDLGWLNRVSRIVIEAHAEWGDPERIVAILEGAAFRCTRRSADLAPVQSLRDTGYLYAARDESVRKIC